MKTTKTAEPTTPTAQVQILKVEIEPLLVDVDEVAFLLSVSKRTVWRMVREGKLPNPVRFNRKLVRWNLAAVKSWLDSEK